METNDERTHELLSQIRNSLQDMQIQFVEQRKDIEFIKTQTTKTNGRVSANEENIRVLQNNELRARAYVAGAVAVTTVVFSCAIFVVDRFIV